MKAKIERRELQSLYDLIPKADIPCVEGCSACCGPVPAARQELARAPLLALGHTDIETLMDAVLSHSDCGTCPYITESSHCAVYEGRPFLCRIFGTVLDEPKLRCKHGLRTTRPLSKEQADKLLVRYLKILRKDKNSREMVLQNAANWMALQDAGIIPDGTNPP